MTNREKFTEIFGCEIAQHDNGEAIPGHCKILIASDRHFNDWLKQEYVPSAQPECEDAVSKKWLVEAVEEGWIKFDTEKDYNRYIHLVRDIAPSVTPKQPGWTYIEEALPATIINKHTNDYQEYNCLCDFGDYGFDVRTYKFGNGHFWNGGGIVDKYVTAWQPLPEIPDALKPKPWEGGQK